MHPYDLVHPNPRFFRKKNGRCLLSIVVRLQIAGRKGKQNSSRNTDLKRGQVLGTLAFLSFFFFSFLFFTFEKALLLWQYIKGEKRGTEK